MALYFDRMSGCLLAGCECVCDTHHFLIRELPSLDATTVSDSLLVPLALGVAEQVHL